MRGKLRLNQNILNAAEMDRASKFMPIAMLILITKIGLDIGPNLQMLMNSGLALISLVLAWYGL